MAAISNTMMFTGLYPGIPHAFRVVARHDLGEHPVRTALVEWGMSALISVARPAGFLPLPGA
ncbi:MAG TPA: hypothetical protein VFT22_44680, partial [Kofleriaceae bacterium]|nr:hypothetical protein [Kofleriaceae bacterium]